MTERSEIVAWDGYVSEIEPDGYWGRCKRIHGPIEEEFETFAPYSDKAPREKAVLGAIFRAGVARDEAGAEFSFIDWNERRWTQEEIDAVNAKADEVWRKLRISDSG